MPTSSAAVGTRPPDQFAAVLQFPLVATQVRTVADAGHATSASAAAAAASARKVIVARLVRRATRILVRSMSTSIPEKEAQSDARHPNTSARDPAIVGAGLASPSSR